MEMHNKPLGLVLALAGEGTADALVLFRLSGDPFNATALWLLKAVAVCQPDLF